MPRWLAGVALATALVALFLLRPAFALDVEPAPDAPAAELTAFDAADKYLREQSYSRACDTFTAFLKANPGSVLAREATVKRITACMAVGRESNWSELQALADKGPIDLARALANVQLAERGDRSGPKGDRLTVALEQLEALARRSTGRWQQEGRSAFLRGAIAEMERNAYSLPSLDALTGRILALGAEPSIADHARFLRSRARLGQSTGEKPLPAAEKELLEVSRGKSEWADDALYEVASFYENHGDFVTALGHYEMLVKTFSSSSSNVRSNAESRAAQIREPRIGISVNYAEYPGQKPLAYVSHRNVKQIKYTLRRADPRAQTPALMFNGGQEHVAGVPGEVVKSWTDTIKVPRPHAPGDETLELDLKEPGIYLLEATSADGPATATPALVQVTTLASVLKVGPEQALVFTADAMTGQGVPGAQVTLFYQLRDNTNEMGKLEGKSDANGLCRLELGTKAIYRAISWSGEGNALAFSTTYSNSYAAPNETLAYVMTDRPLYKPGETVGIKVFLRRREGGPSVPVSGATFTLQIHDASGREVLKVPLTSSAFGTATAELKLGKDAQLGAWGFWIQDPSVSVGQTTGAFRVEEFKPPEYTVSVEPVGKPKPGETVKLKIAASFFFGGPVADAQGRAIVTERQYSHAFKPWPEDQLEQAEAGISAPSFDGGDYYRGRRNRWDYYQQVPPRTLTFKTGADGTAILEIPPAKESALLGTDRTFDVQVFVTDASRREVQGHGAINVSATPVFVDVRTDRILYKPGERVIATLRAEDANGRPEGIALEARLVKLDEKGVAGQIATRPVKVVNGRGTVQLDADALGPARLEVRAEGAKEGDPVVAFADLWLTQEERPFVPNVQGFLIISDRTPLKVGDKARALIVAPHAGGHVLLTVEGSRLHHSVALEMKGRSRYVEIPLSGAMTPNVFFTAGRFEELNYLQTQSLVRVGGSDVSLDVQVLYPKAVTEPGKELTATIAVSGKGAQESAAEVSVSVVDEALFALEPEKTDLLPFFGRRQQELRVSTAASTQQRAFRPHPRKQQPSAESTNDRKNLEAQRAQPIVAPEMDAAAGASLGASESKTAAAPSAPRSVAKEEAPMKRKGGASRDDEAPADPAGASPEAKVRRDFGSSAGWFSMLKAGVPGAAITRVVFPDSITSWRTVAIAVTRGPWIGVGHGVVRTEKDLMVRLQAPRFFTERDEVTLSAIVTSRLKEKAAVEVTFDAPGLKPLGVTAHKIDVPAGGDVRVDARFLVVDTGDRKVKVTARTRGTADAMEWTLPSVVHGSAQRKAFAGRLSDRFTLTVALPERRNPLGTRFELTTSPSLLAVMLDALPYLAQYPYGCVEQTLSRFVPAAIAARAVNKLGVPSTRVPADLNDMVDAGLKRLYGFQHGDGGWGWWQTDATNRWMSAYALYGLSLGKDAGLNVDAQVIARGRNFVSANLGVAQGNPDEHAFMVFALAATGGAPKAALTKAFEQRIALSKRGRALLALALEHQKDPRARIAVENMDDFISQVQRRSGEAAAGAADDQWSTSETIEATAYALMAIIRHDAKAPLITPLTDFLVGRRNGGKWRTTRDTAFSIYALSELALREEAQAQRGTVIVSVNGKEAARMQYSGGGADISGPIVLDDKFFKAGDNTIEVRRDGKGTGYYSALWDVYNQDENLKQVANEVKITRKYTVLGRVGGEKEKVGSSMEYGMPLDSGERVRVDLEITASKPVEFVMVEDLKAAGLEAVLLKSGPEVCQFRCAHAELRTDRVAMFLPRINAGVTSLSYELRAEVPGRFHALPARLEAMYAPELRGTSDEMRIEVRDPKAPGEGVAGAQ